MRLAGKFRFFHTGKTCLARKLEIFHTGKSGLGSVNML